MTDDAMETWEKQEDAQEDRRIIRECCRLLNCAPYQLADKVAEEIAVAAGRKERIIKYRENLCEWHHQGDPDVVERCKQKVRETEGA